MSKSGQTRPPLAAGGQESRRAWQLEMFSRSVKKQLKLRLLLDQIGDTAGRRCLLISNGDNNGALNHHFRKHGGEWTWVENEADGIAAMQSFLGERVLEGDGDHIPLADEAFDVVVSIDVHEHLDDCAAFNRELARVTRRGGTVVVTTPNGDPWKPVTVLKQLIGMTPQRYGHRVVGYNSRQLRQMLSGVGLVPVSAASYSKFFTEMIELALNFAYVMVLARKSKAQVKPGTIAPSSAAQLRSVDRQYRLYSSVYPLLRLFSRLDALLFPFTGYAVSVVARRPAGAGE